MGRASSSERNEPKRVASTQNDAHATANWIAGRLESVVRSFVRSLVRSLARYRCAPSVDRRLVASALDQRWISAIIISLFVCPYSSVRAEWELALATSNSGGGDISAGRNRRDALGRTG